jgi:hypothetical protein
MIDRKLSKEPSLPLTVSNIRIGSFKLMTDYENSSSQKLEARKETPLDDERR